LLITPCGALASDDRNSISAGARGAGAAGLPPLREAAAIQRERIPERVVHAMDVRRPLQLHRHPGPHRPRGCGRGGASL